MASKMNSGSLKNLCECPVCFEPYKDPRLLKCGHQFCQSCLTDITKYTTQGHIPCPVCREVTEPQLGDVTTLPRSTLHQYIQELIFRKPTEEALGQKCTKCKVNKPTRHCPECTADLAYLCDKCFAVHQQVARFANHSTVQFDPLLVCCQHPNKMVENFCYQCNEVACLDCLFESHEDHKTVPLKKAAEDSRKVLKTYLLQNESRLIDTAILDELKEALVQLEDENNTLKDKVRKVKTAWKKLEVKLDIIVKQADTAKQMNVRNLLGHQTKITEVATAQEKMLKMAESLLGDVSDPQVIMGSRDLPEPDIDITEIEVNIPVIGEMFDKMAADLETMAKKVNIKSRKEVYKIRRGRQDKWKLQKMAAITASTEIGGVCFDRNTKDIVIRVVDNTTSTVQIYNTKGELVKTFGQYSPPVAATYDYHQVVIDTKRDLYLLPCENGSLVRMDKDGRVRDSTKLGSNLCGVAYIPDHDLYVLSDIVLRNIRVFLVSPDTLTVVRSLGRKGTFSRPCNVCVGDINGSTTIVVSDCGNHTLYLYSVSGELIRTYGPDTHTLGSLSFPWGVSVDRTGRIVVCDYGNYRVLRVWSDKDGDHWECLLDQEQLGGCPRCVDIDNDNRLMAVSVYDSLKLYTF